MATGSLVARHVAWNTTPNDPFPTTLSAQYVSVCQHHSQGQGQGQGRGQSRGDQSHAQPGEEPQAHQGHTTRGTHSLSRLPPKPPPFTTPQGNLWLSLSPPLPSPLCRKAGPGQCSSVVLCSFTCPHLLWLPVLAADDCPDDVPCLCRGV